MIGGAVALVGIGAAIGFFVVSKKTKLREGSLRVSSLGLYPEATNNEWEIDYKQIIIQEEIGRGNSFLFDVLFFSSALSHKSLLLMFFFFFVLRCEKVRLEL
jgi:hypothetical protein